MTSATASQSRFRGDFIVSLASWPKSTCRPVNDVIVGVFKLVLQLLPFRILVVQHPIDYAAKLVVLTIEESGNCGFETERISESVQ